MMFQKKCLRCLRQRNSMEDCRQKRGHTDPDWDKDPNYQPGSRNSAAASSNPVPRANSKKDSPAIKVEKRYEKRSVFVRGFGRHCTADSLRRHFESDSVASRSCVVGSSSCSCMMKTPVKRGCDVRSSSSSYTVSGSGGGGKAGSDRAGRRG